MSAGGPPPVAELVDPVVIVPLELAVEAPPVPVVVAAAPPVLLAVVWEVEQAEIKGSEAARSTAERVLLVGVRRQPMRADRVFSNRSGVRRRRGLLLRHLLRRRVRNRGLRRRWDAMLRRLAVLLGELQWQRLRPGWLRGREPALHRRRAVLLSSLRQRPLQGPLRRRRRAVFQRRGLLHGSVQQRPLRLHCKRRLRLLQ
jgi:hypothetical protein